MSFRFAHGRLRRIRPLHIALLVASALYLLAGAAGASMGSGQLRDAPAHVRPCGGTGGEMKHLLCRLEPPPSAPRVGPTVQALQEAGPLKMSAQEREAVSKSFVWYFPLLTYHF